MMANTITCPTCLSDYRLPSKAAGRRLFRLRCHNCGEVFPILGPAAGDRPRIMIAHPEGELRRAVAEILVPAGYAYSSSADGEEALSQLQRQQHAGMLVDCALPGLFAFELIEQVRQDEQLAGTRIILLSSVFSKTAYKRRPTSLYGADEYIEKHHLPDALAVKFHRLLACQDSVDATEDLSPATQNALNERLQGAEEKEVGGAEFAAALQKARRFARILVADIGLYYQEQIDSGIQQGNFSELLAEQIVEGRRLLAEKVPAVLLQSEDFLGDAMAAMLKRRSKELAQENLRQTEDGDG